MERKPRGAARLLPPLALGVLGLLALGASFVAPARGPLRPDVPDVRASNTVAPVEGGSSQVVYGVAALLAGASVRLCRWVEGGLSGDLGKTSNFLLS
eukprot:g3486.t1